MVSELYFAAEGFAWTKGIDDFNKLMPKDRFYKIYLNILRTKGFKWAEINFLNWVTNLVIKEDRKDS